METEYKVSIITPVYNVKKYISECILSVINQTYSNIELILVDDCSTDNSIEIAQKLLTQNPKERFSYKIIRHNINKGVSVARNTAIKNATGDLIFCLDSDDRLELTCIKELVDRYKQTKAEIVICGHHSDKMIENRGGHLNAPIDIIECTPLCIHANAELWYNVAPWCKLIEKKFLEDNKISFLEGIINEDVLWTFQLSINAHKIAFLNRDLYYYRYNTTSIMSDSKKEIIIKSSKCIIENYIKEIQNKVALINNLDIYKLFIRQVILYYTHIYDFYGYNELKKCSSELQNYKYNSTFFSPSNKSISIYYKLWNLAFKIPKLFLAQYIYIIITLQKIKSSN